MSDEILAGVVGRLPVFEQWAAVLIVVFGMGLVALCLSVRWLGRAIIMHAGALRELSQNVDRNFEKLGEKVEAAHRASDRKAAAQLDAVAGVHRAIDSMRSAIERMFQEFPEKLFREAEQKYPKAEDRERWNKDAIE